jgi:geranylgeranyl diphosphate synthase type I
MQFEHDFTMIRPMLENVSEQRAIVNSDTYLDHLHSFILNQITLSSTGHLTVMTLKHFSTRGKMLRPLFIKKIAESFNLDLAKTINWAAACEILHNATLIHDDLQDGDDYRRGVQTTWKLYGSEQAINVGDFLLVIAPSVLYSPDQFNPKLLKLYTKMSSRIVCGQVNEFEINKLKEIESSFLSMYLNCISGKTSTLFSGLALGVGLLADQDIKVLDSLEEIFFKLGHLFQMQDDILDLYGDKERLEKGCDIKEGKFSFLVARHLDSNPEDFETVRSILFKDRTNTTQKDINDITDLFVTKGTLDNCIHEMHFRTKDILEHEYLSDNIVINELVHSLIEKILEPISHLEVKVC